MTEEHGDVLVTQGDIASALRALGVTPGATLLVHSSLRAIGNVLGGPVAVILALQEVLGDAGTLVMPAHSADLSDPSLWENPPVPEEWWPLIRESMPSFDPDLTPTWQMGVIAECFRKQPGTLRSYHPEASFVARGPLAAEITRSHSLEDSMGEASPLARVYDHDGWVLLLGVDHDNNSSLHLAEYRAEWPGKRRISCGAPLVRDGRREWVRYQDLELSNQDFVMLGRGFEASSDQWSCGRVGKARAGLYHQRALVDFAVGWLERSRSTAVGAPGPDAVSSPPALRS